jgi:flagellar hook-basal body complex protein FliE
VSPVAGVSGVSGVGGVGSMSPVTSAAQALSGRSVGANEGPAQAGSFAASLTRHLDGVQQLQGTADTMAVQAATGDLTDVHDYMIAASQAQVATELTVAIRNKAVDAFNEIMRMQA